MADCGEEDAADITDKFTQLQQVLPDVQQRITKKKVKTRKLTSARNHHTSIPVMQSLLVININPMPQSTQRFIAKFTHKTSLY